MSDRDSVVTLDELDNEDERGHGNRRSNTQRESSGRGGSSKGDSGGSSVYGVKDLLSKTLQIQSKRFFLDVKENRRGRFIKMAEVGASGKKSRLLLDMQTANEFHDRLTEFSEYYATLGAKSLSSAAYGEDMKIKSETIFAGDRRYYMDLKENTRGRFLKVSMTLPPPSSERCQIVIPAQGMIDIRDALTDILNDFGTEARPDDSPLSKLSLTVENKQFFFDTGENRRGTFLRISEVSSNFRTAINIPESSWAEFRALLRKSCTKEEPAAATQADESTDSKPIEIDSGNGNLML